MTLRTTAAGAFGSGAGGSSSPFTLQAVST